MDYAPHEQEGSGRMDDPAVQEARFRARFEQSRLPQVECDRGGRLSLVNDALCALVGRSREQLVGRPVSALNHSEDPGRADRQLGELLSGQCEAAQYERVLRGPDGAALPVFVDVTLLRDADERPAGAASYYQDLRALHESERLRHRQQELYDAFERLSGELALVADREGTLLYVSPAVYSLLGFGVDEVISREGWSFVHPDDEDDVRREVERVVVEGGTRTWTLRARTATGDWRWIEQTTTNLLDSSIGGIVSNLRDITERVEAEQALRASELRYRMIAETAQEGILAVSDDGSLLFANARMAAILGVSLGELYERSPATLFPPDVADDLTFRLRTRAQRGPERYEVPYPHPDGTERVLSVSAAPLPTPAGKPGSFAMVSDVTDLRRYERELAAAALRDGLTGLPNRALLTDRLEMALVRARGFTALLLVSLDRLQLINQSYGHRAGDALLARVAERLLEVDGRPYSVGRIGGDTFAVVCEDTDEFQSLEQANEVLAVLGRPFVTDAAVVHLTASVGVAVAEAAGTTSEDLLRHADIARQAARAAGGNRVHLFDQALAEQVAERLSVATELREAIAQDQLTLHHQPTVDLRTGRVVGVEALVRWDHPERGAIRPEQLLSVALLTGLAPELDRWVLQRALAEYGRLRARDRIPPDAHLAVNLAAVSLAGLALDRELVGWAAAHGVPAQQLVVDITEMTVLEDSRSDKSVLRRLREQGVGIALDDFGTGHSSLSYLRDLPLTALKIDTSLVRDVGSDPDALAIVASIVDLARAVDITAVAEGVESVEQVTVLRRLGCALAQGRMWSPPVPASEIELSGAWMQPFETARLPSAPDSMRTGPPMEPPVEPEHGLHRLLALHREGASLATVAAALNSEGFRTPGGSRWHRTSVARVVADAAYRSLSPPS
jgi:diguanylate cyclase (GGDEF)-like protein/PAS domain S-box-containing protein